MTITILSKQVIADGCKTHQNPTCWKHVIATWGDAQRKLESVVKNNDVIEIGCGYFGGIARKVLELGCRSYVGVDLCTNTLEQKMWAEDDSREVTCMIRIPEYIANDPRAQFVFGIDFYSYLLNLPSDSFVTVSTGFFHDVILIPGNQGKEYMEQGIEQICRITKRGLMVGLHMFILDNNCDQEACGLLGNKRNVCDTWGKPGLYSGNCPLHKHSELWTSGKFFRESFKKFGVTTRAITDDRFEQFFYLDKP